MSKQAFAILPKIRQVDQVLTRDPTLQQTVREVHPELCFTQWNSGQTMRHHKSKSFGRQERETLIGNQWPGLLDELSKTVRDLPCQPDDLNDALAALWTAERIQIGKATVIPTEPEQDRFKCDSCKYLRPCL